MEEEMRRLTLKSHNMLLVVNLSHVDRLVLVEKLVEMKVSHTSSSTYTYNAEKNERTYRHTIIMHRLEDAQALDIMDMLKEYGAEYEIAMTTPHNISLS